MNNQGLKTAIVYDWVDSKGGIERVIPLLIKEFNADLFTSYFDIKKAPWANKYEIKSSFINKLPRFIKKNRLLSLVLYPYAFESFNFSDYDLVISISSAFSKSVITKPSTKHINYLLTPTRYFWVDKESYFKNPIIRKIGRIILPKLKKWDIIAASKPDTIISISNLVKKRVKQVYKRNSSVIYPPFDINYWTKIKNSLSKPLSIKHAFFLLVSRLEPYKRIDIAIEAFNKLGNNLIIVGSGSQKRKLKKTSGKNITFVENLSDKDLAKLYSKANALIMPQIEEFGMVSLEAQFFGCPVISYKNSGAKETIIEEKTGIFFNKQASKSLIAAIVRYKSISYNLKKSTKENSFKNIKRFDKEKFIYDFKKVAYL
ncbi:MAG: glycosyltransferase [bacterium]